MDEFGVSLRGEARDIESMAHVMVIEDDAGLSQAAELAKVCKKLNNQISDLFEPMRKSAKEAYDAVLKRKKEFLEPVEKADKTIREKMKKYTDEKAKREREEAEARRIEAERIAAEKRKAADEMESLGDEIAAEFLRMDADMIAEKPFANESSKVDGVTAIKSWEIVSIDDGAVPVSIGGTVIRPVDKKAIEKLIRDSKGTVEIPGVKYKETHIMRIS